MSSSESDVVIVDGPDVGEQRPARPEPVAELYQHGCGDKDCTRFTIYRTVKDETDALNATVAGVPILHRRFRRSKDWHTQDFTVQSPQMRELLGEALAKYQDFDPASEAWTFKPPFKPLVHRWAKLQEIQARLAADVEAANKRDEAGWPGSSEQDEQQEIHQRETKLAADQLVEFLHPLLAPSIDTHKESVKTGKIAFRDVWQIFPPGTLAASTAPGSRELVQISRVTKYSEVENDDGEVTSWSITTEHVEWNGQTTGYITKTSNIDDYDDVRLIRDLPLVPLAWHPEGETQLRERLLARGRKFEALRGYNFRSFDGVAATYGQQRKPMSGRIVIDAHAYFAICRKDPHEMTPLKERRDDHVPVKKTGETGEKKTGDDDSRPGSPVSSEGRDDDTDSGSDDDHNDSGVTSTETCPICGPRKEDIISMTDDECILAEPYVIAMDLKTKEWGDYDIDLVQDIRWRDEIFDKLVLPKGNKELAWAFVENKALQRSTFDDFVESKGKGLILLMFGPPGVGKTYTAEAVAEKSRVPLYCLSAGMLGTNPEQVEKELDRALDLCRMWNAMLLLDEADIFLAARNNTDLARNELVALFLTKLEYYQGTLFMTTNRISSLDHAFQSRVDLFLPYHDLTPEARRQVWDNFIAHAGGADKFDVGEEDLASLSRMRLNGREIKNLTKSATLLSAKSGEKVPASRLIMLAENRVNALEVLAKAEKEH